MRQMRAIREAKGLSLQKLENLSGVKYEYIRKHETGEQDTNRANLGKIAKVLGVTINELNDSNESPIFEMACLNQMCLLNKDKKCMSNVVLSGRAGCAGRDQIKPKWEKINFNNTKALFVE